MEFTDKYKQIIEQVNEEQEQFFNGLPNEAVLKLIQSYSRGGKKIRPLSLIHAYALSQIPITRDIIRASICVELFHASTLIHDDIMDEDTTRRKKETIFETYRKEFKSHYREVRYEGPLFSCKSKRYAVSNGILAGNILNSLSFRPLIESGFDHERIAESIDLLTDCQQKINLGQIKDIQFENTIPSEEQYLKMLKGKTGELIKASVLIGATLAGLKKETKQQLSEYAMNLSVAFQLIDDILDTRPGKGHTIGSDILQGKTTLLVIKSGEKIIPLIEKKKVNEAIEIMKSSGAVEYVENLATEMVKKSLDEIKGIKNSEFFRDLANFVISRTT